MDTYRKKIDNLRIAITSKAPALRGLLRDIKLGFREKLMRLHSLHNTLEGLSYTPLSNVSPLRALRRALAVEKRSPTSDVITIRT